MMVGPRSSSRLVVIMAMWEAANACGRDMKCIVDLHPSVLSCVGLSGRI